MLISRGAALGALDAAGVPPIDYAVRGWQSTTCRVLLADRKLPRESIALLYIIQDRRVDETVRAEIVSALVAAGADPSSPNLRSRGVTCIHIAAGTCQSETLRLLLEARDDLADLEDEAGRTVLQAIFGMDYTSHTEALACVNILLKYGARPNRLSKTGKTLLHDAASIDLLELPRDWNHGSIIDLLVKIGVDIEARDPCLGQTALHIAAKCLQVDNIENLLKCGANPWVQDTSGRTPLALVNGRSSTATSELEKSCEARLQSSLLPIENRPYRWSFHAPEAARYRVMTSQLAEKLSSDMPSSLASFIEIAFSLRPSRKSRTGKCLVYLDLDDDDERYDMKVDLEIWRCAAIDLATNLGWRLSLESDHEHERALQWPNSNFLWS